ncbi:MAG: hypothetical protein WC197_04725 [Candidatus Gastranaerophilaceae bacterium]
MYINKCTKCGAEFETKNPKRVICPACLYPDKSPLLKNISPEDPQTTVKEENKPQQEFQQRQSYSQPENREGGTFQNRNFDRRPPQDRQGGYGDRSGAFRRPLQDRPGGYSTGGGEYRRPPQDRPGGYGGGGGFRRPPQDRPGGYGGGEFRRPPQDRQGGYGGGGGFRRPPQDRPGGYGDNRGGGFGRPPQNRFGGGFRRPQQPRRQLLISREQVAQIEVLYKRLLPLPNPDAHEVIGQEIELEPNKVFFGINLVRQKLRLPKLPFPKRKLALTVDQLMAIKNLYEPLLPLPPISCHKIIAKQLKIDEWRVHVGIGIIRKQMNLPRWNPEREDAPEEFKKQLQESKEETKNEEK